MHRKLLDIQPMAWPQLLAAPKGVLPSREWLEDQFQDFPDAVFRIGISAEYFLTGWAIHENEHRPDLQLNMILWEPRGRMVCGRVIVTREHRSSKLLFPIQDRDAEFLPFRPLIVTILEGLQVRELATRILLRRRVNG